jgi:hypothetical protein
VVTLDPKPSAAIVAYEIDLRSQLVDDTIERITPTIAAGTVVVETSSFGEKAFRLLVSGGADLQDAVISVLVATAGGQSFTNQYGIAVRNAATAIVPATTSKRTVINMAFEEIGLAGYEFDATPEEQSSALRRLDAMMAEYAAQGIVIGYAQPYPIGGGDLDQASGLPDWALNIIVIKLARRIMPVIGKTMSAETRQAETQGWNLLTAKTAIIPERVLPRSTPVGAGNKPWSTLYPFASGAAISRTGRVDE